MRSHDCVVKANVGVVVVAFDFFNLGNVGIIFVFAGSDYVNLDSKMARFGGGFLGPNAGLDIGGLSCMDSQVLRHHSELRGAASLQEQNLVVVRHLHQFADARLRVLNDGLKGRRAVAHFHDALACSVAIHHLGRAFL